MTNSLSLGTTETLLARTDMSKFILSNDVAAQLMALISCSPDRHQVRRFQIFIYPDFNTNKSNIHLVLGIFPHSESLTLKTPPGFPSAQVYGELLWPQGNMVSVLPVKDVVFPVG